MRPPGSPCSTTWPGGREWRRRRPSSTGARPSCPRKPTPTTPTPTRSTSSSRSAATTSRPGRPRSWPPSGSGCSRRRRRRGQSGVALRPVDGDLVGGRGGPAGAGRHLVVPRRRAPARRAHQQPRLRRVGPARGVRGRVRRRRRRRVARPGLPRPGRRPHRRARRPLPPAPRVRRRMDGLHRRPRPGPQPAVRGPRSLRERARPPARAPAHPAAVERRGRAAGQGVVRAGQERQGGVGGPAREKQAGKIKATERKLDQLEAVDKPWEGWRLQLALTPTARSGQVVARLDAAVIEPARVEPADGTAHRVPARPPRPRGGLAGPAGHPRRQRIGQDHPAAGHPRRAPADVGPALARPRCADRVDGPGPRALRRGRAGVGHAAGHDRHGYQRGPLAAGQVRARRRPRRPGRSGPLAR